MITKQDVDNILIQINGILQKLDARVTALENTNKPVAVKASKATTKVVN